MVLVFREIEKEEECVKELEKKGVSSVCLIKYNILILDFNFFSIWPPKIMNNKLSVDWHPK